MEEKKKNWLCKIAIGLLIVLFALSITLSITAITKISGKEKGDKQLSGVNLLAKNDDVLSMNSDVLLASESYSMYLGESNPMLKELYLLNAFYHNPDNTDYAREYLDLLDPVDDYSLILSFCSLLEEIIYRVSPDNVEEYYNMILQFVGTTTEIDDYHEENYSFRFDEAWALYYSSKDSNYYSLLEDYYLLIDNPSDEQAIKMISARDYNSILTIKNAVSRLKEAFEISDSFFSLFDSVSQSIASLLMESVSIEKNDYFENEIESAKSEIINDIDEIYNMAEQKALLEIKKAWDSTRKPLDYNNNKITNDAIYSDMINFNATVASYSVYGSSSAFVNEVSKYSQMCSERLQIVSERRYTSYQIWAAKIISKVDALSSKEKTLDKYEELLFFKIDKSLLSIQLSSWYDELLVENLKKENLDRFGMLIASDKMSLEEF